MAQLQDGRQLQAADRHRLPGRALSRRAAEARSPRSTRCSAPGEVPEIVGAITGGATPLTFYRSGTTPVNLKSRHPQSDNPPAPARSPTYIYDADTPRAAGDAEALRLREDRRRLRLQVRVLHHPDAARRSTAAGPATRSSAKRERWRRAASRNCCSSRRTRRSTASTATSAARSARLLRELNAVDGLEWIRLLYLYPTTIDDDDAGGDGGVRQGLQLHRPAAAARVERGAQADEAARHAPDLRHAAGAHPRARARRRPPHHLHRRLPRRDRGGRRGAVRASSATTRSTTSASSPTRTRKARRPSQLDDDVPARVEDARGGRASWGCRSGSCRSGSAARIGERARVMVDGPSRRSRAGPAGPAGDARRRTSMRRSS